MGSVPGIAHEAGRDGHRIWQQEPDLTVKVRGDLQKILTNQGQGPLMSRRGHKTLAHHRLLHTLPHTPWLHYGGSGVPLRQLEAEFQGNGWVVCLLGLRAPLRFRNLPAC